MSPSLPFLFHQDLIVATLASGSRGNCTFIGDQRSGVLVDCGLSTRQVVGRLADIGLGDVRIEGVLVTHEHADHVGAARILCDRLHSTTGARTPFYMSRGTRMGLDRRCTPQRVEIVRSGRAFRAGPYTIEPYSVPHDTRDPIAFLVSRGELTVGVLTDLGRSTRLVEQHLARMDIAVVEFNHDLQMLIDGPYPWSLKQRVRGPHGHLSNAQAGALVEAAATGRLQHLVLAHLSEDNNTAERAADEAGAALARAGLRHVQVTVACQGAPVGPMRLAARSPLTSRKPRASGRPRAVVPALAARQLSLF
jgi:phosphoribosyl 1,2-cyclic phosphodiesterase